MDLHVGMRKEQANQFLSRIARCSHNGDARGAARIHEVDENSMSVPVGGGRSTWAIPSAGRFGPALDHRDDPTLDVEPVHQDAVTAARAHQADVGAQSYHRPLPAPARMLAPELQAIPEAQLQRGCHRHSAVSAAVAPVKLNAPAVDTSPKT